MNTLIFIYLLRKSSLMKMIFLFDLWLLTKLKYCLTIDFSIDFKNNLSI